MPEVSVIIPTFNRAAYLVEAVQSVLNQSFRDFELIVIDDGSTDETITVLRPFACLLRYQFQENQGVSSARNAGISLSKGEYIAFLDSDDLWINKKLEEQMLFFKRFPEAVSCYTDEIWIRNGIRVNPRKKHQKHDGWIFNECLPLCIVSPSSICLRRAVIDEVGLFDVFLPAAEDYDYWLRLSHRYPINFLAKTLIIKRGGHRDQLSRRTEMLDRFRIIALEKLWLTTQLNPEHRLGVLGELIKKCRIVATGAKKRQKSVQHHYYQKKMERYEQELERVKGQRVQF